MRWRNWPIKQQEEGDRGQTGTNISFGMRAAQGLYCQANQEV